MEWGNKRYYGTYSLASWPLVFSSIFLCKPWQFSNNQGFFFFWLLLNNAVALLKSKLVATRVEKIEIFYKMAKSLLENYIWPFTNNMIPKLSHNFFVFRQILKPSIWLFWKYFSPRITLYVWILIQLHN